MSDFPRSDFTVRADHVDVEEIMRQIRARIRDKRGADYTEAEVRELAAVKLERFLDPRSVRSDLLVHFRRQNQPAPLITPEEAEPPLYEFHGDTVYSSSRGAAGKLLTFIRRLLKPFSKLLFHVDTLWDVLSKQSRLNAQYTTLFQRTHQRLITRDELDGLNFEMFNNLVVELTRVGIEVRNLRMQVEAMGARLDFDERRARALEGVVQYKPGAPLSSSANAAEGDDDGTDADEAPGPRRRRRRRGRRRSTGMAGAQQAEARPPVPAGEVSTGEPSTGEPSNPSRKPSEQAPAVTPPTDSAPAMSSPDSPEAPEPDPSRS